MGKLYDLEALEVEAAYWRASGLRVAFTCGAFDLLHAGHVDFLEKTRQLCDRLIVAVNSDASIRRYKSLLRPVVGEQQRARIIGALACVDAVVLMPESRPLSLIERLRPDIYAKGGDYQPEALRSASAVAGYGGRTITIPVTEEISTTEMVARIHALYLHAPPERVQAPPIRGIVFLDRDGTLISNVHFLNDSSRVRLRAGVGDALKRLQDSGFLLIVVTNQQGIGLGYFDYDVFVSVNSEMLRELSEFSVRITRFYFCPHSAGENCDCRKPAGGLLRRAMADFQVRPEECFMIGDSLSDMAAAAAAGCEGLPVSDSTTMDSLVEQVLNTAGTRRVLQRA